VVEQEEEAGVEVLHDLVNTHASKKYRKAYDNSNTGSIH
jgi:hypothetical protein